MACPPPSARADGALGITNATFALIDGLLVAFAVVMYAVLPMLFKQSSKSSKHREHAKKLMDMPVWGKAVLGFFVFGYIFFRLYATDAAENQAAGLDDDFTKAAYVIRDLVFAAVLAAALAGAAKYMANEGEGLFGGHE